MGEVKVSIVMSAFNAEQTVKRAIESVLNQTYKNIELIIVEDCSTDDTLNVINSFEDSRIKVIVNKENVGCGACRNIGVHNITGQYTAFLDSDDYLEKDFVEKSLQYAIDNDSDFIQTSIIINEGFERIIIGVEKIVELENELKYFVTKYDTSKLLLGVLIKSSLWESVEYSDSRFMDDARTLFKLVYFANKRTYVPYFGYHWVMQDNSLTHKCSPYKLYIYRALYYIDVIEFFKDKNPSYTRKDYLREYIEKIERCSTSTEEQKLLKDKFDFITNYYNKIK